MRTLSPWTFAAVVFAAGGAHAQDARSADAFVRQLYAAYHGDGPDYLGRQAASVFAPPLLALIRRDAAETPAGDVGALDGDPICDCQDFGGLRLLSVKVEKAPSGETRADVHLRISREPRAVQLDLITVHGHWRVSDVHTAETPSLVSLLTRSLRAVHPKD